MRNLAATYGIALCSCSPLSMPAPTWAASRLDLVAVDSAAREPSRTSSSGRSRKENSLSVAGSHRGYFVTRARRITLRKRINHKAASSEVRGWSQGMFKGVAVS